MIIEKMDSKELDELVKDKERLDWLSSTEQSIGNVLLPREIVENNIHSLRSAIDETMRQGTLNA